MKIKINWLYSILIGAVILSLSASSTAGLQADDNGAMSVFITGPTGMNTELSSTARAIDYGNCTHLYAVQSGDTLEEIASHSATTADFVRTQNGLDDEDDLYPGLVLCLETDGNAVGIPVTGGERSGVEVSNVTTDQTVTVRGVNFPEGENLNVYIFQFGVSNPSVIDLDPITVPANGTFEMSFRIPTALRSFRNLVIRFRNPDENISATATFINAPVQRITPDECAEYYTVRSGDVLGLIARDVGVSVERLIELNNLLDANIVFPGQMLCAEAE